MKFVPLPGFKVKLFFKNSPTFAAIEGIVQEWSDNECVLLSEDGKSQVIIPNIDETVLLVKIEDPNVVSEPLPPPLAMRTNTNRLTDLQRRLLEASAGKKDGNLNYAIPESIYKRT